MRTKKRLTVGVVEEHPLAARYIERALRLRRVNFRTFRRTDTLDGKAHLRALSALLIDVEALGVKSSCYLHSLRLLLPGTKILALGSRKSNTELSRFLCLGVQGFVSFEKVDNQLHIALHNICEGELWFSREVLELFIAGFPQPRQSKNYELLTSREEMIITLLQQNLSNKEIGSALQISENTVKCHVAGIFNKLGVHDRHALARIDGGPIWLREVRAAVMNPRSSTAVDTVAHNDFNPSGKERERSGS